MKRSRFCVAAAVIVALLMAASTSAAETVEGKKTEVGIADTMSLGSPPNLHSGLYTWARAYKDLRALHAGVLRVPLNMRTVSLAQPTNLCDPSDPAYDWTLPDLIVRQVQTTYARLIFDIDVTPAWLGPDKMPPPAWAVSDFACAAQSRYSGTYPDPLIAGQVLPEVSLWEVLNEPNMISHYNPAYQKAGSPDRIKSWVAGYARLADAVALRIHQVNPEAEVAAGALANAGNVAPLDFVKGMATAVPNPNFDAISVHPYPLSWTADTPSWSESIQPSPTAEPNRKVSFANLYQLRDEMAADWPGQRFNIWLTEIAWQTDQLGANEGVSLAQQASYLQEVFDDASAPGTDIEFVCWFLMLSEPRRTGYSTGFQTGLSYLSGPDLNGKRLIRTPAFYAFAKWAQTKR